MKQPTIDQYLLSTCLFTIDELNEQYEDYGAIIINEEGLKCAIDWNRNHAEKELALDLKNVFFVHKNSPRFLHNYFLRRMRGLFLDNYC